MHLLGGGGELEHLDDLVLEDHLAGGGGDILADLELVEVGLADRQLTIAARQVRGEILHAPHQAFAIGGGHLLQGGRVGHQEIGRRKGVGEHLGEELDPALGHGIDAVDAGHQAVEPVRGQQIGLFHHVEDGIFRPARIEEPLVALAGLDDRRGGFAGRAPGGVAPQVGITGEEIGLGPHQHVRLSGQAAHDFGQGCGDVEGVGRQGRGPIGLAHGRLGEGALGRQGRPRQVDGDGLQGLALFAGQQIQHRG